MATKMKSDAKILKGKEAEDAVLTYIKKMNRPFGAVDVSANLKNAVPKAATQKILVSLAERGELTQKLYGKTIFFVANQTNLECLSPDRIAELEIEYKAIDDANKCRANEMRSASNELDKLKSSLTNDEISVQLRSAKETISHIQLQLAPLRSGTPLISPEELAQVNADWAKWRAEWVRRKKIFHQLWCVVSDVIPPQEATILAEDLGIEFDTEEHLSLERGSLCAQKSGTKRKRV